MRILVKPKYYGDENNPLLENFLSKCELPKTHKQFDPDDCDVVIFKTRQDAERTKKRLERAVYKLEENEICRPDYEVCE